MSPVDKYADKIQALLAKAESTDSAAEAEALTARAEELMVKYSIDQAMIDAKRLAAGGKVENIVTASCYVYGSYEAAWPYVFNHVVTSLGSMKVYLSKNRIDPVTGKKSTKISVVGFESDVQQAMILLSSLQLQAMAAMKTWWATSEDKGWMNASEAWRSRRQFIVSFGEGAGVRIRNMKRKVVAESSTGTDIVLRDRGALVEAYVNQNLRLGEARGGIKGGSTGHHAGRTAGLNANTGGNAVGSRRGLGA